MQVCNVGAGVERRFAGVCGPLTGVERLEMVLRGC